MTPSYSSAWVPITMPAVPEETVPSAWRRTAAPCEPVTSVTWVACSALSSSPARPIGPSSSRMLR